MAEHNTDDCGCYSRHHHLEFINWAIIRYAAQSTVMKALAVLVSGGIFAMYGFGAQDATWAGIGAVGALLVLWSIDLHYHQQQTKFSHLFGLVSTGQVNEWTMATRDIEVDDGRSKIGNHVNGLYAAMVLLSTIMLIIKW